MIKPAFRQQAESSSITSKNVRSIHGITCDICDAGYMPSQSRQDLLQAPPSVLESTFMSMCHYCFRCRRPACPACWDAMHGVCGACVQEAHLPFRSSASPLSGILFPPSNAPTSPTSSLSHMEQSSKDTPIAPLLICIRSGRFQQRTSTFEAATTTTTIATTATTTTIATSAMLPTTPPKRYQSDPIKEQQMTSVKKTQPAVVLRSEAKGLSILPGESRRTLSGGQVTEGGSPLPGRGEPCPGDRYSPHFSSKIPRKVGDSAIVAPAQEAEDVLLRTWTNIFKTIERVLNVILLSVLLFVLVLMLLAELSAGANAQILQLFHVDIRSEMAYLLYAIQQIHV